ncbi:MAG: DUF5686 family protein [Owenweeksia sp.]|nr:DUF5686 family protein [Owenweeksia sp.]
MSRLSTLISAHSIGPIDLDLERFYISNQYEGLRPGLSLATNSRFSKWLELKGYLGYGFRDEEWKYKLSTAITLNHAYNLKLLGGYRFDVFETGGLDMIQDEWAGFWANNFRLLSLSQMDRTWRSWAGFSYDPLVNMQLQFIARREDREITGSYRFAPFDDESLRRNRFQYFELTGALEWSRDKDFIEGPGFGKIKLSQAYPVVNLQYTKGLKGVWGSDFDYHKIDLRVTHKIRYPAHRHYQFGTQNRAGNE